MGRTIVIAGHFPVFSGGIATGATEFVASHGVREGSGAPVILPQIHPRELGARFDAELGEWVLDDEAAPAARRR